MSNQQVSDILGMLEMDEDAKKVFLSMPRNEQLLAILGMQTFARTELAKLSIAQIKTNEELESFKREQRSFRKVREEKEKELDEAINELIRTTAPAVTRKRYDESDMDNNTTQKIVREITKAFASKFDVGAYFRDKILPTLITWGIISFFGLIVIVLFLYFENGGKP